MLRAEDFDGALGETNNPDWKTVAYDRTSGQIVAPNGSIGFAGAKRASGTSRIAPGIPRRICA